MYCLFCHKKISEDTNYAVCTECIKTQNIPDHNNGGASTALSVPTNLLVSCPDCGGVMKDKVHTSGYAIYGNFYCVQGCGFKTVSFKGNKEHRECVSKFSKKAS